MQPLIVINGEVQEQEKTLEFAQRVALSKLLTKSTFFRELEPSMQTKLPEIAQCASKPAGSVIFRQGDVGLHCYIVLSGKVGVWIASANSNKDDQEDEEIDDASTETPSCRSSAESTTSSISTAASASDKSVAPPSSTPRLSTVSVSKTNLENSEISKGCLPPVRRNSLSNSLSAPSTSKRPSLSKLDLEKIPVKQDVGEDFGNQVATLGPGSIFGELALLHEQPRNASITCSEDCELVVIKKNDFNALLKREIHRAKEEKLNFLQAHCPGCKRLSALKARKIDTVMYAFEKTIVPKGHIFFKQDGVSPAGIFLVSSGSVELRSKTSPSLSTPGLYKPKTCNLGVLLKGAAFGCPLPGMHEAFSAVATSPCEVYQSTGSSFSRLPRSFQRAIQDNLMETMLWRVENMSSSITSERKPSFSSSSSTYNACNSRPFSAGSSRPSTPSKIGALNVLSCTPPSRSRPFSAGSSRSSTPSKIAALNGLPCTSSEPDMLLILDVAKFSGKSLATPLKSSFTERAAESSSPSVDTRKHEPKSGVVARTRNMIAINRVPRSSSLPVELKQADGARPQDSANSGHNPIVSDIRATVNVRTSRPQKKERGQSFNLTMERCKTFGGHRLRAVRNSASAPSLTDQVKSFSHGGASFGLK